MPQFSYMPHQFLGKNEKEPKFDPVLGPSLPKYKDKLKKFLYDQTSFVIG